MPEFTDLHTHSSYSDGLLAPADLVRAAGAAGLAAIAVTDHDTTAAWDETAAAATDLGLSWLPGIEFSCRVDEYSVHVLGYLPASGGNTLAPLVAEVQANRRQRNEAMLARLREAGIRIDKEKQEVPGQFGRPHMARLLVECGAVSSEQEAFVRYLRKGARAFVPRRALPAATAIAAIGEAGGVAVFAHPGALGLSAGLLRALLDRFVKMGIDGIETCHPLHSKKLGRELKTYCREHGLLVTGGSDFHGRDRDKAALGECGHGRRIEIDCFNAIRERINKNAHRTHR